MVMIDVCGIRIPDNVPTISLCLEIRKRNEECPNGSWSWVGHPDYPRHHEYVFSEQELVRVIDAAAIQAGIVLAPTGVERFRLVARGLYSGRCLATGSWRWVPMLGRYDAEGDTWVIWDAAAHSVAIAAAQGGYTLSGLTALARRLTGDDFRTAGPVDP